MGFKVGQKVTCIKDWGKYYKTPYTRTPPSMPQLSEVLTVKLVHSDGYVSFDKYNMGRLIRYFDDTYFR